MEKIMTSITNLGYTSKELYSFKTLYDVPKNFSGICQIDIYIYYYKDGKFHREDGPASEDSDGNKFWYIDDELHRLDGPAIEFSGGTKEWYINGHLHRTDGPAIERSDGHTHWYLNHQRYGINNEFTNESWKHFQRTLLF